MQQLVINVESYSTSTAIEQFVKQYPDASLEIITPADNDELNTIYGVNNTEFEDRLNIGIAQSVLGITKPWSEIKEGLLNKIIRSEKN